MAIPKRVYKIKGKPLTGELVLEILDRHKEIVDISNIEFRKPGKNHVSGTATVRLLGYILGVRFRCPFDEDGDISGMVIVADDSGRMSKATAELDEELDDKLFSFLHDKVEKAVFKAYYGY